MKTKLLLLTPLYLGLSALSSAFTLDFSSVANGTTLTPALIINVPGYGDVQIDAASTPNSLVVDDRYEVAQSLNFGSGDSVKVTFLGDQPVGPSIYSAGANIDETFELRYFGDGTSLNEFVITLNGSASVEPGAGITAIHFNAIPEPSASLLGLVGCSLLVLRRRR